MSIKLLVIGDAGVGKTNLLARYINDSEPSQSGPTIGVDFQTKMITFQDGTTAKVQFWDTAGMERYRAITLAHYRKADGAMIVYELTNSQSFEHCKLWYNDLKAHAGEKVIAHLVGNKADLITKDDKLRAVSYGAANQFAVERSMRLSEISALSLPETREAFDQLLEQVKNRKDPTKKQGRVSIQRSKKQDEKGCCS